jgi:hypothetical protein
MRAKWFAGIIVGILLLYFGFMGASGVGLTWTSATSLPTVENFNDLAGWQPYSSGGGAQPMINPAGQLELHAGQPAPGNSAGGTDDRSAVRSIASTPGPAMNAASAMTISIKMMADNWGTNGHIEYQLYTGNWWLSVGVYKDKVTTNPGTGIWPHTSDTGSHTYSMAITSGSSGTSLTFTVDSTKLGTTSTFGPGVGVSYWGISLDAWDGMLCHIDSVDIESGNVSPPPNNNKYTLTINAQDNTGNSLSVPVTVTSGTDVIGPRSTPNAVFGPFNPGTVQIAAPSSVTVGSATYGFTHWNDDWTNTSPTRNYDVESDTTLTATYTAGQPGPGPSSNPGPGPGPIDILGNLTGIFVGLLNNSQLRQLEMAVGGLTAVISGIIFILPAPKRYGRPPPPAYYPG